MFLIRIIYTRPDSTSAVPLHDSLKTGTLNSIAKQAGANDLHEKTYGELLDENSLIPIKEAVRRIMTKNKLGKEMMKKFKPYKGEEHPHVDKDFEEIDF